MVKAQAAQKAALVKKAAAVAKAAAAAQKRKVAAAKRAAEAKAAAAAKKKATEAAKEAKKAVLTAPISKKIATELSNLKAAQKQLAEIEAGLKKSQKNLDLAKKLGDMVAYRWVQGWHNARLAIAKHLREEIAISKAVLKAYGFKGPLPVMPILISPDLLRKKWPELFELFTEERPPV